MHNHLYYTMLERQELGEGAAKLAELKYFVREEVVLDEIIAKKFPITYFGNPSEYLNIKGTDKLISAFKEIYAEKLDFVEQLENIEYVGLTDKNQLILHFKSDGLTASGVYNFSYSFLDELFHMGKFSNFCMDNNYQDILRDNLLRLFQEQKTTERQYRLIQQHDNFFLRGHTSNRYKNYDNNVVLYLTLLNLHKYAHENNINYAISRARLSDSEIRIIFEQEQSHNIPGVGKVYFGLVMSNSEVRESAVSLEVRYRIVDVNDSRYSFAATPVLRDSVFNIYHNTSVGKAEEKLNNIGNIKEIQASMITLLSELKNMKTLSHDAMFSLFQKIVYSKNFKVETKQKFRDLYDKNDIENAYNIIQAFDKINNITTDIDERIFLERIYHDLIQTLANRPKT